MSEHPNHDLLADLAAEVLPEDLAGHVQNHVYVCGRCAALLADAESIRLMLLQVEPEQMPDEVLVRLERAVAEARAEDETRSRADDAGETRVLNRVPPAADPRRADPTRRIGRAVPVAATGTMASVGGPKTSRLNRMSAPTQSARRQAIEEQKADRPSRFEKVWPVLKVAAGVLVVAGIGVGALQLRGDEQTAADSTAASGSAPPILAPVQSTETNYAKGDLPEQVKTLITDSEQLMLKGQESGSAFASTPPSARAAAEPGAENDAKAAAEPDATALTSPSPGAQGQLLRSPEALQACLGAIGAAQVQPVAVDLARYDGREAAIIVLPAEGGGYDVWVVARDCRPDSDGAIAVVTVER